MIKNILLYAFIGILSLSKAQSSYYINDTLKVDYKAKNNQIVNIAATCLLPSGNMNPIPSPPGSFAVLQAGGYCNPSGSYGSSGTVCWTFIPTGNSVTINSGYSTSGCGGISFGPFNLFSCAPVCASLGSGLNFTVVPGQCYTWCMSYNGVGGMCSFNDFCPYYIQTTVLPLTVTKFNGYNKDNVNILEWETANELNVKQIDLEYSVDMSNWELIMRFKGLNSLSKSMKYYYEDYTYKTTIGYYRLKETDLDGTVHYYKTIAINNTANKLILSWRIVDLMGNEVQNMESGVYIKQIIYTDNTSELKKIIIK